jgi:hypothetical protein
LIGYNIAKKAMLNSTKNKIEETSTEIAKHSEIESLLKNIERGTELIKLVEADQNHWSLFLPQLEKLTPNDIQYTTFTLEGGSFKTEAIGKSVTALARLIYSLENFNYQKGEDKPALLFSNVMVTEYTKNLDKTVKFAISFDMLKGFLW